MTTNHDGARAHFAKNAEIKPATDTTHRMDMSPGCLVDVQPSFGFKLLWRKQRLKFDLIAGHKRGMESFVAALIESGCRTNRRILQEVADVTGDHSRWFVRQLLTEGEGVDWMRHTDQSLSPIYRF